MKKTILICKKEENNIFVSIDESFCGCLCVYMSVFSLVQAIQQKTYLVIQLFSTTVLEKARKENFPFLLFRRSKFPLILSLLKSHIQIFSPFRNIISRNVKLYMFIYFLERTKGVGRKIANSNFIFWLLMHVLIVEAE